jgi:hypothetical protein
VLHTENEFVGRTARLSKLRRAVRLNAHGKLSGLANIAMVLNN